MNVDEDEDGVPIHLWKDNRSFDAINDAKNEFFRLRNEQIAKHFGVYTEIKTFWEREAIRLNHAINPKRKIMHHVDTVCQAMSKFGCILSPLPEDAAQFNVWKFQLPSYANFTSKLPYDIFTP